jgi:hypothetical protein
MAVLSTVRASRHRGIAHPAGQQGLADAGLEIRQRSGHCRGIAAGLGRVDDEDPVDLLFLAGGVQRQPVMFGRGVLGQVDQVAQRCLRRQDGLERLGAGRTELAELQVDLADPVGCQHARTAPVGDDRQATTDCAVARSQALGGREQRHERAHPHRTRAPQGRIEHVVAAHNGARVGSRGLVARGLATRLEHHHRFGIGSRPQRAHEAARVGDAFEVDHDAVRLLVGGQEIQHLRDIDRGVRAERDHGRESDGVLAGPVQDGRGQRPRLRHQRQRTRRGHGSGHTGIEAGTRSLEAQAIRAKEVHAVVTCQLVELTGQRGVDAG